MLGPSRRSTLPTRGLWRIFDDRIIAVDRAWPGPTTVLVPSEDVLTLAVDLPFATRRQRETALAFAIEDTVAEPLTRLHCALGSELSPRRHLAGVVRHERMRGWIALLDEAGLDPAVLTPDALMLPMPTSGAWSVRTDEGRALVRTDQGTAFALPARDLATAWSAAGKPRLMVLGGDLPEAMLEGVEAETISLGSLADPVVVIPPLDLRQGDYASVRDGVPDWGKTLAWVAGLGVVAHLSIMAIDTFILHQMADNREVEARALLAQVAPQITPGEDLIAAADRVLPQAGSGVRPYTRLMAQTAAALPSGPLSVSSLDYGDRGTLNLAVTVPNATALENAVGALKAAGLAATATAGTATDVAGTGLNAEIRIESAAR